MMISVCMATRNGERYIREQIDSILVQLSENDELVISDDRSNDETIPIIRSYNDTRIKIYHNTKEKGVAGNFENCLRHCNGDFIFLADQDDVWMAEKIKIMLQHLKQYDLVISDCSIAGQSLEPRYQSFFHINNSGKGFLKNLFRNSYMGCCMAFRKNVLQRVLPFPRDILMHDLWIGLICELHFKVHFIPQPLMYHRRHHNNASTTAGKSENSFQVKIFDRLKIIRNLLFHRAYAG
jgi:glycosyltransferase involved in cell wall biosynthesis